MHKPAKVNTPIDGLLAKRWSPRAFDANKDINPTQVLALLEAARWAPSCFGDQPWYFIVCHKSKNPAAWEKALECLVPFNQDWAKHAPLLLFALSKTQFHHNGEPNRWAQYDTGAASENLCLQATSMGLHAHQMGGFDENKVISLFEVPEGHTVMAGIAIGYQAQNHAHLPEELQERETAERERHGLGKRFFDGVWGVEI